MHTDWQTELHPDSAAVGGIRTRYPLASETRAFGKLVDVSSLLPGDLILVRALVPDWADDSITTVQTAHGYDSTDARWTHAQLYLGPLPDEPCVLEADTDYYVRGDVRVTRLEDYSRGKHVLRFRRPKASCNESDRFRLCLCAMLRLGRPYALHLAVWAWIQSLTSLGRGAPGRRAHRKPTPSSFMCSTLYTDAYRASTRRYIDNCTGSCLPACLSLSEEFDDVTVHWRSII
jgi:hypothetical protein